MKTLLLFLATIQLTINCFALELVKCGSVKIPEGFDTNAFQSFRTEKGKHDGTTLFYVGRHFIVVKPFIGNSGFIDGNSKESSETLTNNWSFSNENGVTSISFTRTTATISTISSVNVIFATFSELGFVDLRQVSKNKLIEEVSIANGNESRKTLENTRTRGDYLLKIDLSGKILQTISLDEMGILAQPQIYNQVSGSNPLSKKLVFPKLNGDSIDFYLVTDPDLFPDTALGSPRVDGGSATFNVTTSSEEPVEIESSNDLKVWKRIQSLENANGRSVTVPMGPDKEFLRAIEP